MTARKMKDSGIEWIGEIPEEWKIAPLRSLFSFGKGLPITKENLVESGVPVISYGQIHAKNTTGVELQPHLFRYVSEQYLADNPQSLVSEGDFIFADTSEDYDGCGNAVYVDRQITLFAGYHTIILKHRTPNPNKYLAYLFRTDCWRSQIRSLVYGIKVFSITQKILNSTFVLLPPLPEQRRIADYLDRKCAEIDRVAAETEKTIEEYKVLKQSIITEAVTKGVRGKRPMKDSGIEWIGEIPEEWSTTCIKFLCSMQSGKNITSELISENAPYPVYGGNGLRGYHTKYNTEGEFLLVGRQGALCGNVHRVSGKFWATEHAVITSPTELADIDYLGYLLTAMNLNQYASNTAAQPGIAVGDIQNIRTCFGTLAEQREIADYLDAKCAEIDRLVAAKQNLLTELATYKKSVIYEYVTGKKEVPECR